MVIACRDPLWAREAVKKLRKVAVPDARLKRWLWISHRWHRYGPSRQRWPTSCKRRICPHCTGSCDAAAHGPRTFRVDGFGSTFGVSHLGHYLLVNLLLPLLQKPGRIVIVASGVHDPAELAKVPVSASVPVPAWNTAMALARGELGPEAADDDASADRGRRYSTTKLANVYFTYGLAARLPDGLTVNAFDPGLMPGTGLARDFPAVARFAWFAVMPRLIPLLRLVLVKNIHTPEESGMALARLIVDPALASTSGKYFEGLREIPSSDESYLEGRAEELWRDSAVLTGFAPVP